MFSVSCQRGKFKFDASGTFKATEVTVSAETTGKIMVFNVLEGKKVKAGQEVGSIDTLQLHLTKMQLLAGMKTVESRYPDISKQLVDTRKRLEKRQEELKLIEILATDVTQNKRMDDLKAQIAVLEKQKADQLAILENQTRASDKYPAFSIQLARIDDQLSKNQVISPVDGIVLAKYAEQGELTAAGKPLFKVADMNTMILRAYLTSGQLSEIKTGQQVTVLVDHPNDHVRPYKGTVSWISGQPASGNIQAGEESEKTVYAMEISVKNDGLLKIGMPANVSFD